MSAFVIACYQSPNAVAVLPGLHIRYDHATGDAPPYVQPGAPYWVMDLGWLIYGVEIWIAAEIFGGRAD